MYASQGRLFIASVSCSLLLLLSTSSSLQGVSLVGRDDLLAPCSDLSMFAIEKLREGLTSFLSSVSRMLQIFLVNIVQHAGTLINKEKSCLLLPVAQGIFCRTV